MQFPNFLAQNKPTCVDMLIKSITDMDTVMTFYMASLMLDVSKYLKVFVGFLNVNGYLGIRKVVNIAESMYYIFNLIFLYKRLK